MNWKKELDLIIKKGCTDSDIEDFIMEHSNINAKEIWDYVFEFDAPEGCKGCEYIQYSGMFPCNQCSRRVEIKDYYKKR